MSNLPYSLKNKKVWVAGHKGMIGSAIVRRLANEDCEILAIGRDGLYLRDQSATETWISDHKPDAIFMAAATVGGIQANDIRFQHSFQVIGAVDVAGMGRTPFQIAELVEQE